MKHFWKRSLAGLAAVLVLGTSGAAVSAQTPVELESPVFSAAWNDSFQIYPGSEYAQVKQAIYDGLQRHQTDIDVTGLDLPADSATVQAVYFSVIKGHPELFTPKAEFTYSYNPADNMVTTLHAEYYYTAEQAPAMQQEIDAVVDQIKSMTNGLSNFNKLLVIHDWLAERMTYDYQVAGSTELTSGRTAYDALVRHQGVCEAYDFGFRLLANALGFETGYAMTADHIWSMVKLDGQWYHVDVTHDDPSINGIDRIPGLVIHQYFLVSDAGVMDNGHGSGSFEATNTASSTRFDGDALFFRNWLDYPDGVAVWNGQVYLTDGESLYTGDFFGSLEDLTAVDTGLMNVTSVSAYPDSTSGLLLTGYETSDQHEGLYRYDQNGLEKLADLSAAEYFNDPSVTVFCSYAAENEDGTISVFVSSTLAPQFKDTVVTIPAPEPSEEPTPDDPEPTPDPESCKHPNISWKLITSPTLEEEGLIQGVCPDCGKNVSQALPYGDLNFDGKVNVTDVMVLAQCVVNRTTVLEGLDLNFDGNVSQGSTQLSVTDVMALAQMVVATK